MSFFFSTMRDGLEKISMMHEMYLPPWTQRAKKVVSDSPGLVNASFSWPKWEAVKMIFFAPWDPFATLYRFRQSLLIIIY